jgi:DNA-binding transcriptional LysR family regulator
MLDVRRLRLLREFADRGTIAATAKALGYTPSAVSQQLAVLEREVGTALLDRTARSAELTDAGRRLADHAERILRMIEFAEADLSEAEPTGQIIITAFPTAAVAFAPALAHGLRHHAGLTFQLRQTRPGEGMRQVRAGEVDIALIDDWTGRLPTRGGGSLRFSLLLSDPLVLVVPAGHWAADPTREIELRQLREEPWLAAPEGEPSRQAFDRLMAGVGGAPPMPWEFEGLGTILGLVARGVGIAAVPSLALAAVVPGIAARELPGSLIRYVYAVVRTASVRRSSVAITMEALKDAVAEIDVGAVGRSGATPVRREGDD